VKYFTPTGAALGVSKVSGLKKTQAGSMPACVADQDAAA
jgi:hypothetical protein